MDRYVRLGRDKLVKVCTWRRSDVHLMCSETIPLSMYGFVSADSELLNGRVRLWISFNSFIDLLIYAFIFQLDHGGGLHQPCRAESRQLDGRWCPDSRWCCIVMVRIPASSSISLFIYSICAILLELCRDALSILPECA